MPVRIGGYFGLSWFRFVRCQFRQRHIMEILGTHIRNLPTEESRLQPTARPLERRSGNSRMKEQSTNEPNY